MKTPSGFSLPSLTEPTGKDSEKNRLTAWATAEAPPQRRVISGGRWDCSVEKLEQSKPELQTVPQVTPEKRVLENRGAHSTRVWGGRHWRPREPSRTGPRSAARTVGASSGRGAEARSTSKPTAPGSARVRARSDAQRSPEESPGSQGLGHASEVRVRIKPRFHPAATVQALTSKKPI